MEKITQTYSAFEETSLLAHGNLEEVVIAVKKRSQKSQGLSPILIFSDLTGKQMDFNFNGSEKEVLQRLRVYLDDGPTPTISGPGRPKLGVVAREVSLLPRHWEWLSNQSGGASAGLRRLVEMEMKNSSHKENTKKSQERTYRFMSAMAGNLPQYEEALRALYAKDKKKFKLMIAKWPRDLKEHIFFLSEESFE